MRAEQPLYARRRRRAGVAALALPAVLCLAVAALRELGPGEARETPCWIFPNLRTLAAPGGAACEIGVGDAIRSVGDATRVASLSSFAELRDAIARSQTQLRVRVARDDREAWIEIPVHTSSRAERASRLAALTIGVALLLCIPFSLLLHSRAPAALPLALFYSAFSLVGVCLVAGRGSLAASLTALAALTLLPGCLFHLALTFPEERRVWREAPAVVLLPYALSGFLLLTGAVAVWQTPALWPAFLSLLLAACAAAWCVLIFACVFALRESASALERTRSQVVLFGSLLLPLLPAATLLLGSASPLRELPVLYLWSAAVCMPLPIALAISRYNLFDLGFDARQGVARVLYLCVSAAALALAAWLAALVAGLRDALPGGSALLAGAFLCALASEPLRARLPRLLEALCLPRLRSVRAALALLERRLPGLEDEAEILGCAETALVEGIAARSGAVFLASGGPLRIASVFGADATFRHGVAASARAALGSEALLQLAATRSASRTLLDLSRAGVALVASVDAGGEQLGLLLLGASRSGAFYTRIETDFVRQASGLLGAALLRVSAGERRRNRERDEAAGRLALALAHDTGKDIHWLRLLSRRLALHAQDPLRAQRDARMIAELCEELSATLRRALEEASRGAESDGALARLDDLVAGVVRRMDRLHGPDRVVDVVDLSIRRLRCPGYVASVLGNVLDAALHASPAGELVRLSATLSGEWLRLQVEDGGRVRECGVGARRARNQPAIGLTVARDITEMLGGAIRFETRGGGTIATIDLPTRIAVRPAVALP